MANSAFLCLKKKQYIRRIYFFIKKIVEYMMNQYFYDRKCRLTLLMTNFTLMIYNLRL